MALWGNNDNVPNEVAAGGTVSINSYTFDSANGGYPVVGTGVSFGATDCAQVGDVIRFGDGASGSGAGGTYFGDAVIASIGSTLTCWIASTAGIDPALGTGSTVHTISQLPKSSVLDSDYSENPNVGTAGTISRDYGVAGPGVATDTTYGTSAGWVGVTTYLDNTGALRVKKEVLVAMSGITTGNVPSYPPA